MECSRPPAIFDSSCQLKLGFDGTLHARFLLCLGDRVPRFFGSAHPFNLLVRLAGTLHKPSNWYLSCRGTKAWAHSHLPFPSHQQVNHLEMGMGQNETTRKTRRFWSLVLTSQKSSPSDRIIGSDGPPRPDRAWLKHLVCVFSVQEDNALAMICLAKGDASPRTAWNGGREWEETHEAKLPGGTFHVHSFPGIRIFLENLRKPRFENGCFF